MIQHLLKTNPVRVNSIAVAAVAVGAYLLPSGVWPLLIPLVAAIVGGGEVARSQVTPMVTHKEHLDHLMTITGALPDPDDLPTTGSPESCLSDG